MIVMPRDREEGCIKASKMAIKGTLTQLAKSPGNPKECPVMPRALGKAVGF